MHNISEKKRNREKNQYQAIFEKTRVAKNCFCYTMFDFIFKIIMNLCIKLNKICSQYQFGSFT